MAALMHQQITFNSIVNRDKIAESLVSLLHRGQLVVFIFVYTTLWHFISRTPNLQSTFSAQLMGLVIGGSTSHQF